MKHRAGARPMLIVTVLGACAGYALRRANVAGGGAGALIALSVVLAVLWLAFSLLLPRAREYAALFRRSLPDAAFSVAGGVLLVVGGFLMLMQSTGFAWLLGALGLLSGACLALAGGQRAAGVRPAAWPYVVAVLFYVAKLFYDFRRWMVDPAVLDYCFWLFAAVSFMLTTFHAAQFCFDMGKRRALAFFSLTGIYFGAVSMADQTGYALVLCIGGTLWMLACAWQALRPTKHDTKLEGETA